MIERIIAESRKLPKTKNFFTGKNLPENFQVPSSILLYCHDFPWPQSIVSSRYMLIIPFAEMTYLIENRQYPISCGEALLVKPYLHRSVPELHKNYLRLIASFEIPPQQSYIPDEAFMKMTDSAWTLTEKLLSHYKKDEIIQASFALTLLLCEISQNIIRTGEKVTSPQINHAMCFVNQYLEQSFGIKDIADKVHLSPSHLRRLFRQETGISLGEYISRRRLSAAQRLLTDTSLRIDAIAKNCGYDSIYAFSRFFKKNSGLSPMQFRKTQRNLTQAEAVPEKIALLRSGQK